MKKTEIQTPLGLIIALADEEKLHLLEFADNKNLAKKIAKLERAYNTQTTTGTNSLLELFTAELQAYFAGKLKVFTVSIQLEGTPFQQRVWNKLLRIPYGATWSYEQLAHAIGNPNGCRAVALANSMNTLSIIVPCHRIINKSGKIGGYAGGIHRKEWLLKHETEHFRIY